MRRSKYGYLLLALLVITGLAGTVTSTSISSKERKFAAGSLKDTRNEFLKSVKNLSKVQLEFKDADKWSVKECVYHAAISEKSLWDFLQSSLKQPTNPEKRSEIKLTDEQVIKIVEDKTNELKIESGSPQRFKSFDEALENFKLARTEHIKYIKNTTEDLRNHVVQTPFGWVDCYQLCLMISAFCNRRMQQIEEVKADSNYPSR
jgi:hypothetical protein